ncbi:hypothetical protein VC83_01450 [Pseudogymnoascus destructans]|uniref:Uncharacterized protein n=1 Tax=Pseudogymnoascus destructans TaxID=655981 RepID=A0A177AKG6_9PEZI|nr:uncharacterized protein VC83_01450 [Pseudogymnoascus destructans]OAF61783.1 hypothetical protein VC83_01450 [Pseudogymnoascus destructans]
MSDLEEFHLSNREDKNDDKELTSSQKHQLQEQLPGAVRTFKEAMLQQTVDQGIPADNLRSIMQSRRAQSKRKRAILKGQFHRTTEELRSQVIEAEEATQQKATTKGKTATNITVPDQTKDVEEEDDPE